MSKKLTIISIVVAAVVIFSLNIIYKVNFFEAYMDDLVITDVDIPKLSDGVYRGQADSKVINIIVDVTIKSGKIESIELIKHQNGQGDGANIILKDIIREQSVTVDNITGATLSSKVMRKAVESALLVED